MKKKITLWLSLLIAFGFTLQSCRNDLLPEHQETYNSSSAFQLTSKTISLNQSKHKDKLIPEVLKTETTLKQIGAANIFGKTIEFGNGISLDTNHVIYMENGADYYTYTFRVIRENSSDNDPLENVVLSPYTDGTYRALLVSYNLTKQEKIALLNGEDVDTKGKTFVTDLGKGNFGQLANKNGDCGWIQTFAYTICSEGVHKKGEKSCTAAVKSVKVTVSIFVCDPNGGGSSGGGGGGTGGGTGGGGGYGENDNPILGGNDGPCTPDGVLTGPQIPNDDIGMNPCGGGIPTIPNVDDDDDGTEPTPCETLKQNSENQEFQSKLDSIKTRVLSSTPNHDTTETQILVKKSFDVLKYSVSAQTFSGTGVIGVKGTSTDLDIADMHNHPINTIPVFSHADIVSFYDTYKFVKPSRKKVYTSYVVSFNGTTYALRMNDVTILDTLFEGLDLNTAQGMKDAYIRVDNIFKKQGKKDGQAYNQSQAEKLFMNVINDPKIGGGEGIHLYRKDADGWGKLNIDANGNIPKENCP